MCHAELVSTSDQCEVEKITEDSMSSPCGAKGTGKRSEPSDPASRSEAEWCEPKSLISKGGKKVTFSENQQGSNNVKNLFTSTKAAFTLAEVLITLGVIGVVAALTLPALLTNIQDRIKAEQKRTVKYKFTQATDKVASLGLIGPYDNTMAFVNELKKHLAIAKVCDSDNLLECWPYDKITTSDGKECDVATKIKDGSAFNMPEDNDHDYSSENVGIVTADGTPMILSYNKKCKVLDIGDKNWKIWSSQEDWTKARKPVTNGSTDCVAMIFEINGRNKPNKQNDDVQLFHANGVCNACAFKVNGKCFGAPFKPTPITKAECESLKSSLGISACEYDDDYWAGAVKECGGVNNMPTKADLNAMADDIYGTSVASGDGFTYATRNNSKLSNYGFGDYSGAAFYVWSGQEHSTGAARYRYFSPSITYNDYGARLASDNLAVCKVD